MSLEANLFQNLSNFYEKIYYIFLSKHVLMNLAQEPLKRVLREQIICFHAGYDCGLIVHILCWPPV